MNGSGRRIYDFGIHSPGMARPLSRFFRYGTPIFVLLCLLRLIPWWLIVLPVLPLWWSMVTTTHEAHQRARIIRRPNRSMTLEEAALERRFLIANAAMLRACDERDKALTNLAESRAAAQGPYEATAQLTATDTVRG